MDNARTEHVAAEDEVLKTADEEDKCESVVERDLLGNHDCAGDNVIPVYSDGVPTQTDSAKSDGIDKVFEFRGNKSFVDNTDNTDLNTDVSMGYSGGDLSLHKIGVSVESQATAIPNSSVSAVVQGKCSKTALGKRKSVVVTDSVGGEGFKKTSGEGFKNEGALHILSLCVAVKF